MTIALYTIEQLRRIEAEAEGKLPPGELMQRAGTALAEHIHRRDPTGSVLIVCGPGNNGGDGYVCAEWLRRHGQRVTVVAMAPARARDAAAAAKRWQQAGGSVLDAIDESAQPDLIVDAMFGIGTVRPLEGPYLRAAEWMSRRSERVIAVDVPSGLDADLGTWIGDIQGVRASETLTFLGAKPGLYTCDSADAAGQVVVDALGLTPTPTAGALLRPDQFPDVLKRRPRNSHKGRFGSLAVVGGNTGMVGAALIAARAALRLGAGRVYVDCIGERALAFDPVQPELMFRDAAEVAAPDAVLIGCGLGAETKAVEALRWALAQPRSLILDADALNLLASDPELRACFARRDGESGSVITPHPLEAARLLGCQVADVQADRVGAAKELAANLAALVVLKGAGTVLAAADQRYWINTTGGPALATAGSGDALAGMLGALVAQGYGLRSAAAAAVWLHGAAADEFGDEIGLSASDIAPLAARLLARLRRDCAGGDVEPARA